MNENEKNGFAAQHGFVSLSLDELLFHLKSRIHEVKEVLKDEAEIQEYYKVDLSNFNHVYTMGTLLVTNDNKKLVDCLKKFAEDKKLEYQYIDGKKYGFGKISSKDLPQRASNEEREGLLVLDNFNYNPEVTVANDHLLEKYRSNTPRSSYILPVGWIVVAIINENDYEGITGHTISRCWCAYVPQ